MIKKRGQQRQYQNVYPVMLESEIGFRKLTEPATAWPENCTSHRTTLTFSSNQISVKWPGFSASVDLTRRVEIAVQSERLIAKSEQRKTERLLIKI